MKSKIRPELFSDFQRQLVKAFEIFGSDQNFWIWRLTKGNLLTISNALLNASILSCFLCSAPKLIGLEKKPASSYVNSVVPRWKFPAIRALQFRA